MLNQLKTIIGENAQVAPSVPTPHYGLMSVKRGVYKYLLKKDSDTLIGLNLAGRELNKMQWEQILQQINPSEIEALNLSGNELQELHFSTAFSNLRYLEVSDCEALRSIVFEGTMPQLERLVLRDNQLVDITLPKNCKSLKFLDLSRNQLKKYHFQGELPTLECMDMSGNRMIPNLTNLKILGIPCPMIHVQPVPFQMNNDLFGSTREDTHTVHIQKTYYIAQYPVTQVLYQAIMKNNPARFQGANRPVENISWLEAVAFIKQLNEVGAMSFRLPTEAEWELAARGGQYSQGYQYAGSDDLKQVGWYNENSDNETKPVGLLMPNELGLYDMSGNVFEWCMDESQNYTVTFRNDNANGSWEQIKNEKAPNVIRVIRGGSSFNTNNGCYISYSLIGKTSLIDKGIGFRLVFPQV